jgi:flavin-dependent dehydrogenase
LALGKELAMNGYDVQIFEALPEEQYFVKYNWSDALELCILREVGLPVPFAKGGQWHGPGVIGEDEERPLYHSHRISELGLYAPDYSIKATNDADFRFVLLDRRLLQKEQVKMALEAGAKIRYGATVTKLSGQTSGALEDLNITGATVQNEDGSSEEFAADLVVDATGQFAHVRITIDNEHIGSPPEANRYGVVYRTVRECENTDLDAMNPSRKNPPCRDHYRLRAPEGYIFFHPHSKTQVDIGGGAPTLEQIQALVEEVKSGLPGIGKEVGNACEQNLKSWPPNALVCTGFMAVGHAAGQLHPTHGCGMATAMMAALLATDVIKKNDRYHISDLWEYGYRWMSGMGAHFAALFPRLRGLEVEDYAFLMEHDIINGETISNDYNGNYLPPNTNELRRLENAYKENPQLVNKWMKLEVESARSFEHYKKYPPIWSPFMLDWWVAGKF